VLLHFVGLNGGSVLPGYQQRPTSNRRDLYHRPRKFFGCEMDHSWLVSHGLLGFRRSVGSSLAGKKSHEGKGNEDNDPALFVKHEP
jgi:hypothetical protein